MKLTEELHRIDLLTLSREEKLAFFINIYNSLVIHAVVHLGYFPVGALERRKFFGDFQYLIGGYAYSLSAIQNGLLRANQRPPYTLTKPFGPRDNRVKVRSDLSKCVPCGMLLSDVHIAFLKVMISPDD